MTPQPPPTPPPPKPPAGPSTPKPPAGPKRALATPEEIAQFLGVPVATLYQWRCRGKGPRSARVGRHIRYRWSDVDSWLDTQSLTGAA